MGASSSKQNPTNPLSASTVHPKVLNYITSTDQNRQALTSQDWGLKKILHRRRIRIENESNTKQVSTKDILKLTDHRLKQLSNFKLSLENGIDKKGVQSLSQFMKNLKAMNKLSLDFERSGTHANKILKALSSDLKNMRLLNTLDLNLYPNVEVTKKEMDSICSILDRLHCLSTLKLHFILSANINKLCSRLRYLRSLTTLHLAITSSGDLTEKCISSLLSNLRHLPLLTNLSLEFSDSYGMDDSVLQCLSLNLKQLRSVTNLGLSLCYSKKIVSSKGIISFLTNLESLTWISSLRLGFVDCKCIDDQVIEHLGSTLNKLTSLSSLYLNLYGLDSIVTQKGIEKLSTSLSSLTSLSDLTLMLSLHSLNTQTATSLFHCISNLPLLSSLRIYLSTREDNSVSNKSIEDLASGLIKLKALTSLHLRFSPCDHIDDKGMQILSSCLKELSQLSALTLWFDSAERITYKGFRTLFTALSQLSSVKSLTLNFEGVELAGTKVLEGLYACLVCLSSLSYLELKFDFWYQTLKAKDFGSKLKGLNPSFMVTCRGNALVMMSIM